MRSVTRAFPAPGRRISVGRRRESVAQITRVTAMPGNRGFGFRQVDEAVVDIVVPALTFGHGIALAVGDDLRQLTVELLAAVLRMQRPDPGTRAEKVDAHHVGA